MGWTLIMDFFLSLIDFCEKAIFIVLKIIMIIPRFLKLYFMS